MQGYLRNRYRFSDIKKKNITKKYKEKLQQYSQNRYRNLSEEENKAKRKHGKDQYLKLSKKQILYFN